MCTRDRLKSASEMAWSLLPSFTSKTNKAFAKTSVVARRVFMSPGPIYLLAVFQKNTYITIRQSSAYPFFTRALSIVRLNARERAWSPTLSLRTQRANGDYIERCRSTDAKCQ
jgi:hypothetical protein